MNRKYIPVICVVAAAIIFGIVLAMVLRPAQGTQVSNDAQSTAPLATSVPTPVETTPAPPSPTPSIPADFVLPEAGIRPYAVMIDNEGTRSLPQGGLDKAQVIYELVVEGGETRLMPVFWGTDPTMIGPVRSARHYFLDYALEHDAIYVHFGGSPMAYTDMKKLKMNEMDGIYNAGEIFWDLTKDRGNWQDSYTSMQKILEHVKKRKFKTETGKSPVFTYNTTDAELADGKSAVKISIRFSHAYTCAFEYDAENKVYKRVRKGEPHMERVSGKQLTGKNVLIQITQYATMKGDQYGRQEMTTVGSGKGYYFSDGEVIDIKWSKASRSEATKYTDTAGNPLMLNPGQTWVEILPAYGKVSFE